MIQYQVITPQDEVWLTAAKKIGAVEWPAGGAIQKLMEQENWEDWERIIYVTDNETPNQTLVAFGAFLRQDPLMKTEYTPFVSSVYVNPDYRKQGISLQVVKTIEHTALELGFSPVYILTRHVGLYEKRGYVQVGEDMDRFQRQIRILKKSLIDE
ncbi:MAG: GNAT family N-acetyltransferase [Aerococcus sp.]|nr:GNAT family N-acetyltransferase [Aerococcus sp.]